VPFKNLIQALLGHAELGDNSRAFVGIALSTMTKPKTECSVAEGKQAVH
jgi:hypothetical protein